MNFSVAYDSTGFFLNFIALSLALMPLVLLVKNTKIRQAANIFAGIYLLYFIAPRLALLWLVFWLAVYLFQRLLAKFEALAAANPLHASLAKATLFCLLALTLVPMIVWKIHDWEFVKFLNLSSNSALFWLSQPLWEIDLSRDIVIPIGLSFATFRALDLLVKTYIGKFGSLSLLQVFYYGFFPPVLVVGPIIEYEEIAQNPEGSLPQPSSEDMLIGMMRCCWGFFKVLFLSSLLLPSAKILESFPEESAAVIWIYLFAYTWYFYINFSGYADIAIGSARLFGYRLKENFNNPFFARNIIEFWSSWHMSLYRFARRNVFVPLGGYREKHHLIALSGTMMTIALWHALSASMVAFGLYHTAGLLAHRHFTTWKTRNNINLDSPPLQLTCLLCTYTFVMLSFPLIVLPLEKALAFYGALLGMGG